MSHPITEVYQSLSEHLYQTNENLQLLLVLELTKVVDFHSFDTNVQKAIDILQLWDGSNETDEVAPTIYNKFIYEYLTNTFKDEMGTTRVVPISSLKVLVKYS